MGISWTDIEILSQPGGAPLPQLRGPARARFEAMGGASLSISLTHDLDIAQAFCVLLCMEQITVDAPDVSSDQIRDGARA